jgi:hypothetical protein
MKKISINELQFCSTTRANQQLIKQMAEEFSTDNGVDWNFEYRWMTMTEENYLLAKLKYDPILSAMTVRTI